MKYRNLVEVGLHREDGGDGVGSAGVGIAEGGGGEGEAGDEVASLDEWDRELMGDGNGETGDEISGDDGAGTMPKTRRRGRRRQRRRVDLPRYHVDLETEDDEDFMDGELVGADAGAAGGEGEDMSE